MNDPNFTYDFLTQQITGKKIHKKESFFQYSRYSDDQYQNYSQKVMFDIGIKVIEQQKRFFDAVEKKFTWAFKPQTCRIVKALKAKKEK